MKPWLEKPVRKHPVSALDLGYRELRVNIHRQLSQPCGRRIHTSLELFLWNLRRQLRAHPEPQSQLTPLALFLIGISHMNII